MGQARARGTRDERVAQAKERVQQEYRARARERHEREERIRAESERIARERREKEQARLAAMTPEEREAEEAWAARRRETGDSHCHSTRLLSHILVAAALAAAPSWVITREETPSPPKLKKR